MRVKITKKGYVGDLTIDESQLGRFEQKGWKRVPDKAAIEQPVKASADTEKKTEQS